MNNYVCGYIFNEIKDKVILVLKDRPDWQKGLLNCVGGSIEDADITPRHAMVRECLEETGISTGLMDWRKFAFVENTKKTYKLFCFTLIVPSKTDIRPGFNETEIVSWHNIPALSYARLVPKTKALIEMALDETFRNCCLQVCDN